MYYSLLMDHCDIIGTRRLRSDNRIIKCVVVLVTSLFEEAKIIIIIITLISLNV